MTKCPDCGENLDTGCNACRSKIRFFKCPECRIKVPNPDYKPR